MKKRHFDLSIALVAVVGTWAGLVYAQRIPRVDTYSTRPDVVCGVCGNRCCISCTANGDIRRCAQTRFKNCSICGHSSSQHFRRINNAPDEVSQIHAQPELKTFGPFSRLQAKQKSDELREQGYVTEIVRKKDGSYWVNAFKSS